MKICLICEGCYPYVVGGVSSWVQQLIKLFPEYEFSVYAIAADVSYKGRFQYEIPDNVSDIQEIFLNDAYSEQAYEKHRADSLKYWEIEEFKKLMMGQVEHWDSIFDFFVRGQRIVSEFLMSEGFYNIVREIYDKYYENTVYSEYLWTMRSMYLTLFHMMNHPPKKADIYHCVSTGYAGIAGALGKRCWGGRLLISEHGIYTREREEEIIKASWVQEEFKMLWINYFKNLSRGAYLNADKILALFETNNRLQIENGANPVKCDYVANGINYELYENLEKNSDPSMNVGAVIRVSPIKDIKTMLHAFDEVYRRVGNVRFYIMGPTDEAPEYYEECRLLLEELGTENVVFTGRVNVMDYLGKMNVIVLSSLSEGQPLALMEAMAAGIPCVSTNVGCCRELFEGVRGDKFGRCGLLAPIMNYHQLAENIIEIITDKQKAEAFGTAGKNRIRKYYSEEKFKRAYKEIYEELGGRN